MPETKTLSDYENLKYPIEIFEDDDAYIASIPDLPGCVAYGDTMQEAVESLRSVKKLWFEGRLEAGLSIPEPAELDEYSGKFVLRISRGLHKSLQREARRQGTSLNHYVGQILAERHKLIDLERTVQDAVSKCFPHHDPSCESLLTAWKVEENPARCPTVVNTTPVVGERLREIFVALAGEKQSKSYEVTLRREAHSGLYWTSDAPKKAKAHDHHG